MAEQRLIDANALPYENQVLSCDDEWCLKVSDIENAPTIDAVEVVRCKDCKHRLYPTGMCSNPMAMGFDALEPKDFDFCSCGQREDTT